MLCEIAVWGNFFATWTALSVMAASSILFLSGPIFVYSYVNPTYEAWTRKTNPKYPTPEMIRMEIVQTLKGLAASTLCPALSLYLAQHGISKAYCGAPFGYGYEAIMFLVIWIGTDFWEFVYHRLGHLIQGFWDIHKHHHVFHNPSPFAVIADEWVDMFVRAFPLVLFPMLVPINMDVMFAQFALMFYGYGVYLHWGFEFDFVSAHHAILNTSFQHNLHHSTSIMNKPYHTGFFFKIWDQMWGSMYQGECLCAACSREKGLRSRELWDKVVKPDYSVLLQPSFWLAHGKEE